MESLAVSNESSKIDDAAQAVDQLRRQLKEAVDIFSIRQDKIVASFETRLSGATVTVLASPSSSATANLTAVRRNSVGLPGISHGVSQATARFNDFDLDEADTNIFSKTLARLPLSANIAVLERLARFLDWLNELQEPPRSGWLAEFIQKPMFEALCLCVVLANACFTVYSTNFAIANSGDKSALMESEVDLFFLSWYVIELGMKLAVHRLYFFANKDRGWNIFDTLLVVVGLFETLMGLLSGVFELDIVFMRSLRLLKITKIFRLVRILRFFHELRIMLQCVLGSVTSLFWATSLLIFFKLMFATVLVQGMGNYLAATDMEDTDRAAAIELFGSVQNGVFSLFQLTTGGSDWMESYSVVRPAGFGYSIVLSVYIVFYHIAFINIVTSIFVEGAMRRSQPDVQEQMMHKRKKDLQSAKQMKALMQKWNVDEGLSREQFQEITSDRQMLELFEHHGLNISDAHMFFNLVSSITGSDEVDVDDFVMGCLLLRGPATSVDMQALKMEIGQIGLFQRKLTNHCKYQFENISSELAELIQERPTHDQCNTLLEPPQPITIFKKEL